MFFKKRIEYIFNILRPILNRRHSKTLKSMKKIEKAIEDVDSTISEIQRNQREYFVMTFEERLNYDQTIRDAIARAKDIWGLDFHDASNGWAPSGNQIGRRPLAPMDFGLTSWNFKSEGTLKTIIEKLVDEDAFIIIRGYKYVVEEDIQPVLSPLIGLSVSYAGTNMPYLAFGSTWKKSDDEYTHTHQQSSIIAPKAKIHINAHYDPEYVSIGQPYKLMIIGDVIAKRPYLISPPFIKNSANDILPSD